MPLIAADCPRAADLALTTSLAKTAALELDNRQGATIELDGKPIEPRKQGVLPGPHVVMARCDEVSETVSLTAGETRPVTSVLRVVDACPRWSRWLPWTVAGTGAALAAASIPFLARQRSRLAKASAVADGCLGCDRGGRYERLLADARSAGRYALVTAGVGCAIVLTGVVLVAAQRKVQYRRPMPVLVIQPNSVSSGLSGAW